MSQIPTAEPVAGKGPEEEASRRHYDRWRAVYSRSRLLASLQRKALAQLDPRADDRLLDVACGAGKLVRAAAPDVERAVGVDLSPGMIEEARWRTAAEAPDAADRIEFVVGSSDQLPFADGEFTALVTTTALHHFPAPAASVREMARVLAPGGRLLIGDSVRDMPPAKLGDAFLRRFEKGHVGLQDRRGIERLVGGAGLVVVSSRLVWLGLYAFVAAAKGGAQDPGETANSR
jgi:ubiquinone/menaquinone biosynthesis C-methylase UbiE